jgi:hypothetical protein
MRRREPASTESPRLIRYLIAASIGHDRQTRGQTCRAGDFAHAGNARSSRSERWSVALSSAARELPRAVSRSAAHGGPSVLALYHLSL